MERVQGKLHLQGKRGHRSHCLRVLPAGRDGGETPAPPQPGVYEAGPFMGAADPGSLGDAHVSGESHPVTGL